MRHHKTISELYLEDKQSKPLLSLLFIIVVVGVMTAISFSAFWYSDTKNLVNTIQQTSEQEKTNFQTSATSVNTDGILTVSELLFIEESIKEQTSKLNPETDFGGGDLQKSNLGF